MTSKREVLAESLIVALIDGKPTQKLREQIAVLDRDKAAEAHAQARDVTPVR